MVGDKKVPLTPEEIADFHERERLHALKMVEFERTSYQREREKEYPSIEEQLDLLYHGGLAAWRGAIKAIKDKYPKPEA